LKLASRVFGVVFKHRVGCKSTEAALDTVLIAERLVAGGAALARLEDGQVAFVRGALPGERVRARLGPGPGKTMNGEAIEIIDPSALRCEPDCALAGCCGGCDWLHLEIAAALELKAGILVEALERARLPGLPRPVLHPSPAGRAARARARLHLTADRRVGFLGRRSHEVIPLDRCPALRPALSDRLPALAAAIAAIEPGSASQILLASDDSGRVVVCPLDPKGRPLPSAGCSGAFTAALEAHGLECAGPGDATAPLIFAGPRIEQQVPVGAFFQANPESNCELVERVLELAGDGPGRAVDYFCGAGNLGLTLAHAGWTVQGLELDRAAVELGSLRAAELGLDAVFGVADLELDPLPPGEAELAILDPTRRGARALARVLAGADVPRILHLGCDPATMARDGAILASGGYWLEGLELFDFFPGTHHLEALGLWIRRS